MDTKASESPVAVAARQNDRCAPQLLNAAAIPATVPNNPINGAVEAMVANSSPAFHIEVNPSLCPTQGPLNHAHDSGIRRMTQADASPFPR